MSDETIFGKTPDFHGLHMKIVMSLAQLGELERSGRVARTKVTGFAGRGLVAALGSGDKTRLAGVGRRGGGRGGGTRRRGLALPDATESQEVSRTLDAAARVRPASAAGCSARAAGRSAHAPRARAAVERH